MSLVESLCNARDGFGSWIWSSVAGMKVVQLDAEGFASLKVINKGVVRLFCPVRLRLCKIDKI